jgi:SAM-dependent methyltransferase
MPSDDKALLSGEEWKRKLKQQAEDSREYRHKLYDKVGLKNAGKILDVGCGTGVITLDIAENTNGSVIGVDIDEEKMKEAVRLAEDQSNMTIQNANAENLPFEDETFDLVVFNIVLMHITNQQKAINEMARVTKKGGVVLATLEPDHAGVINYPENALTPLVQRSIENAGGDIRAGRKLKYLFTNAGLDVTIGFDTEPEFLLINDDEKRLDAFFTNFWVGEKLLREDGWTDEQIEAYKNEQKELIESGQCFYLMTAFYAIGKK